LVPVAWNSWANRRDWAAGVADPKHDSTVVRQSGIARPMVIDANWLSYRNECAIAKSVVDPKAIAFGGMPGPLAARAIREPPEIQQPTR